MLKDLYQKKTALKNPKKMMENENNDEDTQLKVRQMVEEE